ncbi:MAG: DUF2252 family protein [Bdellovibrionales bacterium]|nr:DUF2252 family protein [Bdellovibrionales bacterium]
MKSSIFRHSWILILAALNAQAMGKKQNRADPEIVCTRHMTPTLLPPSPTPSVQPGSPVQQKPPMPGMGPTSVSTLSGPLDSVLFLFPTLTRYQLEEKFRNSSTDELMFFRATAPLYYYLLSHSENELIAFTDVLKHTGVVMGDAHPENFGALVINEQTVIYSANDVDDSATRPYVLDLLRYFSAVRLLRPDADLAPLLDAYVAGISATPVSRTLRDSLIYDSQKKGLKVDKGDVDLTLFKFPRNPTEVFDAPKEESRIYCGLALHHYSGTKCLDVAHVERRSGGSAFVPRTWVLIETPLGIRHVEFKTQYRSSTEAWGRNRILDTESAVRIEAGLNAFLGSARNREMQAILSDGTSILMRPRYAGNGALKFSKLTPDQQLSLFAEQANTLGQIHVRTLNKKVTKRFLQDLKKVPIADWEKLSFKLIKEIRQWHQYTKSLP